jgi:hypothetical protein
MPINIDWGLAVTQAIANIPTAIITGSFLFWATHFNKKIADGFEKNGDKKIFGKDKAEG